MGFTNFDLPSILKEFQLIGEQLLTLQMNSSHSGNISVRMDEKVLITRHGAMLGALREVDLIEVNLWDEAFDREASMEVTTHRAIYRSTDARSIIHSHPPYTISLSILHEKILPLDVEGKYYFEEIPIVDEVQKISSFLGENKVVVVRGHGIFATGHSLKEALQHSTALECSCKIIYLVKMFEA
jgi:L-fuculose-phosphate aldolase